MKKYQIWMDKRSAKFALSFDRKPIEVLEELGRAQKLGCMVAIGRPFAAKRNNAWRADRLRELAVAQEVKATGSFCVPTIEIR